MKKLIERKEVDWLDQLDDKTLKEARDVIIPRLIAHYGENAVIRYEQNWDSYEFFLEVERKETEEERLAREKKEQKKIEADRKKFQELKEKYGW